MLAYRSICWHMLRYASMCRGSPCPGAGPGPVPGPGPGPGSGPGPGQDRDFQICSNTLTFFMYVL